MSRRLSVLIGLLVLFSAGSFIGSSSANQADTCNSIVTKETAPTSYGLPSIYIGLCVLHTRSPNCSYSWEKFQEIVLSKAPGQLDWRDFDPLFEIVHTKAAPGTSTFWENMPGELVHRLSKDLPKSYTTLEDTFPAVALNDEQFCAASETPSAPIDISSPSNPPLTYTPSVLQKRNEQSGSWDLTHRCTNYIQASGTSPASSSTPVPLLPYATHYDFKDAFAAWWQAASIRFAREAEGSISVVFEAPDVGPSFCPLQFFGSIEMPSLNRSLVNEVRVLIAGNPSNAAEKCGSGSFVLLQTMVEAHFAGVPGFKYTCLDNPYDLSMVRCAALPNNPVCQQILGHWFAPKTSNAGRSTFLIIGVSVATFLFGVTVVIGAQLVISKCRSSRANTSAPRSRINQAEYSLLHGDESSIDYAVKA